MRSTKPHLHASEDDICDITEILNKFETLLHDAMPFMFATTKWNQDLFAQVALPLEGTNVEAISLEDYKLKDVMLGRPTQDSS